MTFDLLTILILVGMGLFLLLAFFFASYVKAKPNEALIITGPKKQRIVLGKATLRIPFLERTDSVSLDISQVDIKTNNAVPTNEFINIFVDGVGNFRVIPTDEKIKLAGMLFLKHGPDRVKQMVQEVLEGNMREIIGQMKLTQLVTERDIFADKVAESAGRDMNKMGLEIVNLTIQNFNDENNVISDLGIDNIEQIRKDAAIAKARAKSEVEIATSAAREAANVKRVEAELAIADQNTNLKLKEAALKLKADTEAATADAAYAIREAEEKKKINIAEQNANIARREKEIELAAKEVEVEERKLEAVVKKSAEAEKFAKQQAADAQLYERTKLAEAELAEEQREAEARKVAAEAELVEKTRQAEAVKVAAEAEASRIAAIGNAEKEAALAKAEGIKAVALAEAEGILEKAEAMKQMEQAAVLGLVLDSGVLPAIVEAAAAPLAKTEKIVMYGEGNAAKLSSDIMRTSTNILEGIKEATGLDVTSFLGGMLGGKLTSGSPKEVVTSTPKVENK